MKMTEMFLAQLEAESARTRRVVERVPEGRDDWKPHERSMPLGRLAGLVATMPSWLALMINEDSLDLNPPGGRTYSQPPLRTVQDRVAALERATAEARQALEKTSDEELKKPWRLLVSGKVVGEATREAFLRDTFMHLAHHRGQLTVYLRLNEVPVPAIYGPSADDPSFA